MSEEWRDEASCSRVDPEMFFDPERVEEALKVCRRCPVIEQCGEWGIVNVAKAEYGIFGGMTERQRRKAVRARKRSLSTAA